MDNKETFLATVTKLGRITVDHEVRKKLGIIEGTKLRVTVEKVTGKQS